MRRIFVILPKIFNILIPTFDIRIEEPSLFLVLELSSCLPLKPSLAVHSG